MKKFSHLYVRKSVIAVAALALGAGTACTHTARADDKMADGKMAMATDKMAMSADDQKMMMDQAMKMKEMAADPKQADMMKTDMAKMMVMDHMAKEMAMDPQFKQSAMDMMSDANIKKIHEDAMAMAKDPEQMKKMQQEIMADPMMMKMVNHQAMMMSMMS